MSFLIKSWSRAVKGEVLDYSLDKTELSNIISDAFFADTSNWDNVSVMMENSNNQVKVLVFDGEDSVPARAFTSTAEVRSDFRVVSVTIYDRDGGELRLSREDLISALTAEVVESSMDIVFKVNGLLKTESGFFLKQENGSYLVV